MKIMKRTIAKLLNQGGYDPVKRKDSSHNIAVELTKEEIEIIRYVRDSKFTMISAIRLVATLKACRHVVENNVAGDFVECGVWRGGNGILAKKCFEALGSNKHVYMFDTFEGMTAPTEPDVMGPTQVHASARYSDSQRDGYNEWCYASLEDVMQNCEQSRIDMDGVHFIKGDVCQTLELKTNLPSEISVLRLDTDWYESTLKELEVLYPILSANGALLIDDYGHWEGARKAVDEYFAAKDIKPLLHVTDATGRAGIKFG